MRGLVFTWLGGRLCLLSDVAVGARGQNVLQGPCAFVSPLLFGFPERLLLK